MEVAKIFQNAALKVPINIQGSPEEPLFQANQIGRLLGLTNIRMSIEDFDSDEKVVRSAYTLGGEQTTLFLTELGLYRLLGQSRKPVARPFQKWVASVVKEIRLKGRYDLVEQKEHYARLLEVKEAETEQAKKAVDEAKVEAARAIDEATKVAEEAKREAAAKEQELLRYKSKTYEEVNKYDFIYISKEAAELHTDHHKIGRTIDVKKREAQHNTASAQGVKMIYSRPTLNASIIEGIVRVVLQRYHHQREHYMCRTEHSANVLDIACTVVDTLASSYDNITRTELCEKTIEKLQLLSQEQLDLTSRTPAPLATVDEQRQPVLDESDKEEHDRGSLLRYQCTRCLYMSNRTDVLRHVQRQRPCMHMNKEWPSDRPREWREVAVPKNKRKKKAVKRFLAPS